MSKFHVLPYILFPRYDLLLSNNCIHCYKYPTVHFSFLFGVPQSISIRNVNSKHLMGLAITKRVFGVCETKTIPTF